jgi:hypothetical protein
MAWWDSFTTAISGLGAAGKRLTGGGSYLSEDELKKEQELHNVIKGALASIDNTMSNAPGFGITKKATKGVTDLLLKGAVELNQNVLSPYVFRPISTAALLTDQNSPLYKKGEYEAGFQFSDIKAAYNRSAKVSAFQALTKSDLTPIKSLSDLVLSTGKIDLDKVDLWNDESIKQNYVDNAVGRWFTGIGDFVVGTKGINVAGSVAKAGVIKAGKPLGLSTAKKTVEDLEVDMSNGINWAKTNGATGQQTISGSHMVQLAESKDWGLITDLVNKYSVNEKLIPLIHDAKDADVVKDMILADKGNLAAMERLASTNIDKMFDFSDTAAQLQGKFLKSGSSYLPDEVAAPRLKAAYDAAIESNPQFIKIRDAFFDAEYNIKIGGRNYMPIEPVIGKSAIIKAGTVAREIKQTVRLREFDKFAEVLETNIGSASRIGVKLVKWGTTGASRQSTFKPLGFVTFSGMRPLDGRVELNAFLDNLKLFRDGTKEIEVAPNVFEKAADVRRRFEENYMRSLGKNEVEVLENIDAEIGKMIAYNAGWYTDAEIAGHISKYRRNINSGLESVKQNGYGIDHDGRGILVEPQTLRQMAESYRFTPWDNIERQIERATEGSRTKAGGMLAKDAAQTVFRDLNRLWTFNVLVRPMYIIKQSIGEPIISATLAQGINFFYKDLPFIAFNAGRNTRNATKQKISNIKNRAERKAVNEAVRDKQAMLSKAEQIKSNAQASLEDLLSDATSPATKAQHLAKARKDLAAADALLDELELDLRAAVVPYGVKEAIPSIATLERRIAFLESRSPSKAAAAKIAEAKQSMVNYRKVISKLATNKKVIEDAQLQVAKAYDDIDNIVSGLKPALKKQADVWGKSAEFKKRYYAKENQTRIVNGQLMTIDSFVAGPSAFSAAIRAETSNARTADLNLLGELAVGTRKALIERKVPGGTVSVSDPLYFEELAHLANRAIRKDPLMDLILADTPASQLAKWAKSDAGINYMRAFDVYDPSEYASFISDRVALVHRTFPTIETRAAILNREVTGQELQSLLADKLDELYDIVPSNFNYGTANIAPNNYAAVSNAVNNAAATIFKKMASFENPIRNAVFDRVAIDQVARRAKVLMDQGVKITPAQWNALRQAAGREALQELEKTVYTVRRQNRLLNNARFAVAFPTAAVNAFYRYGRLAVKQPIRTTGFVYDYGRLFTNFGVDENGNPTNDVSKITHLIIPGTKELKGVGYADEGIALSARSLGFLLNMPSPAFITSLSVNSLMKEYPVTEDTIRKILTVGNTEWFDVLWPYGPPQDWKAVFTPPYLNAIVNALGQNENKADYLASWNSVYNYHHMLYEMGIEKNFPDDAQIKKEVTQLWWAKFWSSWGSAAGVPYKVEQNPMRLSTNLYYKLVEKNMKQGKNAQEARDLAGDELIGLLGTKFMVDRVSYSGSNKNLNIPATYEAYKRVFMDNDELVGKLAAIDSKDIKVVGLLTADLSRDPSEKSDNILAILRDPNLTLPGTSRNINEYKLKPQEVERERIKQRTWDQYNLVKDALEAKITDGKTLRAHPELKAVLDRTVETYFRNQSQAWYDEYKMAENGDTSYKYARALNTILTDQKFMKTNGNSEFWKDASQFMRMRTIFVAFYKSLPDYDPRKAQIKDGYNAWIEDTSGQWSGDFRNIVKIYFSNDSLKAVN